MERSSRRLFGGIALLFAWTALLTFLSSLWTERQFELPPAWDHALYLSMSLRFHRSLEEGGAEALARRVFHEPSAVAPLFPLSTVPLYRTFGESREVAQLTLAPYLFLLLLGTALLSAGASPSTSALSVFLVSSFTGVVNFSREYMMDLPAASMVTLGLAVLARRGAGVWAGLLAGAALLTKVLAGIFLVGPLARAALRDERRRLPVFALAVLGVAGVWYGSHLADVFDYVRDYGFGGGSIPFRSSSNPGYYLMVLVTQGLGWFPFAAFASSMVLAWRRVRPDAFLLVWLASGTFLLTVLPNKGGERYVLALLPPLAALGASAIARVEATSVRRALVLSALAAGTLNFAGITWPSALSSWTHHHHRPFPHAMPLEERELRGWPTSEVLRALTDRRAIAPSTEEIVSFVDDSSRLGDEAFVESAYREWLRREPDAAGAKAYLESLSTRSRREIVESLVQSEEFRQRPLRVLVVTDHRVFNAATLQYLAESERRPLSFRRAVSSDDVATADVALIKEGGAQGPWPDSSPPSEVVNAVRNRERDGTAFPCPDGSQIFLLSLAHRPHGP